MSSFAEATIEIYEDESVGNTVGPHVCDVPNSDGIGAAGGSLLPRPLSALVGGGKNYYRDPALHALATEPLVSDGLLLPTTVLAALPPRPAGAQRRGIGSDPHASTAKKPSRARVQRRGRLGEAAGCGGGGAVQKDETAGTTSVRPYSAKELAALDLTTLVEHRER